MRYTRIQTLVSLDMLKNGHSASLIEVRADALTWLPVLKMPI